MDHAAEVVNDRTEPVPLTLTFGTTACGPQVVPPGQTLTCAFENIHAELVAYHFGEERWVPAYVGARVQEAQRVTLEPDGGRSFACHKRCQNAVLPAPVTQED